MEFEPKKITEQHVLKAIELIESTGAKVNSSTKYDVVINGKLYPPKAVMRYAHGQMNGLHDWYLNGGEPTNSLLEKLGFEIKDKYSINSFDSLFEKLKKAINEDGKLSWIKQKYRPKEARAWIWLGDSQKQIGNSNIHYEVLLDEDWLYVDLHFEGEKKQQQKFLPLTQNLPEPLKAIPWKGSKSIRYGEGFSMETDEILFNGRALSEDELVTELVNRLYTFEDVIGDKARAILKSEQSNSTRMPVYTPLNQILYGPPGTGKTYNSINLALEILGQQTQGKDRSEIKSIFDQMLQSGQIVFTTFHQSMSYEDFIEGIKPQSPKSKEGSLTYEVKPGIFKKISKTAESNYQNSQGENKKKIPFEEVFELLREELETDSNLKFPLKTAGYDYTILGFSETSILFKKANGGTSHTLSINTLKELYYGIREMNFKQGVGIYYPSLLDKLNSYSRENKPDSELKNYVLIIDEINRGNVSQIFGELITLIEEDKRIGQPERLEVELPYSQEGFSVPPNLFIIGTMNTADRSVEALDTALRRRFSFIEMPPKPDLIVSEGKLRKENGFCEEIELVRLLNTINNRIEILLDRDHHIGHSYFMSVSSLDDLKKVFKHKIIPLLQEYFFGDYGKIGLVLGKGFVQTKPKENNPFAAFDNDEEAADLSQRVVYQLKYYRPGAETDEEFKVAIKQLLNRN